MSTDGYINELLDEMATTPTPLPDPMFAEQLDARLRVAHAENQTAGTGGRNRWAPTFIVAALVMILGLGGTFALRGDNSEEVVMTVASDTSVYFGDEPIPGTPGLVLRDGARIVVGPNGEAVVGGVVLAPGSEALVVDAQVTLQESPTPPTQQPPAPATETTQADADTSGRASATTAATDTRGSDTPDQPVQDESERGTTTEQARPQTSRTTATSTSTPQTSTTRATSTSTTSVPTSRTSQTSPETIETTSAAQAIVLTATDVGGTRVRLDWAVRPDLDPMGWRIRVRRGDREATVLVIRGGDARSATLERSAVSERSVWVQAVDGSGQTIAESETILID